LLLCGLRLDAVEGQRRGAIWPVGGVLVQNVLGMAWSIADIVVQKIARRGGTPACGSSAQFRINRADPRAVGRGLNLGG